jgi:hypothetical protein
MRRTAKPLPLLAATLTTLDALTLAAVQSGRNRAVAISAHVWEALRASHPEVLADIERCSRGIPRDWVAPALQRLKASGKATYAAGTGAAGWTAVEVATADIRLHLVSGQGYSRVVAGVNGRKGAAEIFGAGHEAKARSLALEVRALLSTDVEAAFARLAA